MALHGYRASLERLSTRVCADTTGMEDVQVHSPDLISQVSLISSKKTQPNPKAIPVPLHKPVPDPLPEGRDGAAEPVAVATGGDEPVCLPGGM